MIRDYNEFYEIVDNTVKKLAAGGEHQVAQQLLDAMSLSSSGFEVFGAIRKVFCDNATVIDRCCGSAVRSEVVSCINKALGQS